MSSGIKYSHEDFSAKVKEVHGDNVEVLEEYVNIHTKILIRCKKHDHIFKQSPTSLLKGSIGCPQCKSEKISKKVSGNVIHNRKKLDTESFIKISKEIHGEDRYDYSKVEYVNYNTSVILICKICGKEFKIRPCFHISKSNQCGCPECARKKFKNCRRRTKEEFIELANKIHDFKYDYSKVEYVNDNTPVIIGCPRHGDFKQMPRKHLIGHGCPNCRGGSKANDFIKKTLEENNVLDFKQEKWFPDLLGYNGGYLRFDFFFEERKIAIEFDGFFHDHIVESIGGAQRLLEQQYNDNQKNLWCEKNSVKLIRIKALQKCFNENDKENIINNIKFLWLRK